MRKLLTLVFVFLAAPALAQTAAPTDKFQWQTTDAPLAAVQAYRWEAELDGATTPTVLVATCVAGVPITCTAPVPAVTPSTHVVRIRGVAVAGTGSALVGPWSDPLTFQMSAVPAKPSTPTIIRGS